MGSPFFFVGRLGDGLVDTVFVGGALAAMLFVFLFCGGYSLPRVLNVWFRPLRASHFLAVARNAGPAKK